MRIPWIRRHHDDRIDHELFGETYVDPGRDLTADGTDVVFDMIGDEVEAFLAGDLAEYRVITGLEVASWMLVNRLAHGSHLFLEQVVAQGRGWWSRELGGDWQAVEQDVAQLLVDAFPTANQLRSAQLVALVPLELALAKEHAPRSAPEVMQMAEATILAYLTDRRHRQGS